MTKEKYTRIQRTELRNAKRSGMLLSPDGITSRRPPSIPGSKAENRFNKALPSDEAKRIKEPEARLREKEPKTID